MKIHIAGLGQRDTKTEYEQIIWFFEQKAKMLSKAQRTSYFISLKESLMPFLIKSESFEILSFLDKMVSEEQERRSKENARKAKLLAKLETSEFEKRKAEFEQKKEIGKLISQFWNFN